MPKLKTYTNKHKNPSLSEVNNENTYSEPCNQCFEDLDEVVRDIPYYQENDAAEDVTIVYYDDFNTQADNGCFYAMNNNYTAQYSSNENSFYNGHNTYANKMNYFEIQQRFDNGDDTEDDDSVVFQRCRNFSINPKKKKSKPYIVEEPLTDNAPEQIDKSKESDAPISNIIVVDDKKSGSKNKKKYKLKKLNLRAAFE